MGVEAGHEELIGNYTAPPCACSVLTKVMNRILFFYSFTCANTDCRASYPWSLGDCLCPGGQTQIHCFLQLSSVAYLHGLYPGEADQLPKEAIYPHLSLGFVSEEKTLKSYSLLKAAQRD